MCRCFRLCTSPEQTKKEIQFTLDLYEDNGNDRKKLQAIADAYDPPLQTSKNKKNDKKTQKNDRSNDPLHGTMELFRTLPFRSEEDVREEEEEEEQQQKKYACIPYIPEIAHPLKRVLKKAGVTTIFSSGPKLKNILCGANKAGPSKKKRSVPLPVPMFRQLGLCRTNRQSVRPAMEGACLRD